MPDIDTAALNRSSALSTPQLSQKSFNTPTQNANRASKPSVGPPPPRVNLEHLYIALKGAIGEHWVTYKAAMVKFLSGNLNQAEFSACVNPFIMTPTGEVERLHNQLISGIYGNTTRELPDQNVANWVSANDKPLIACAKPVSGDAAEQRLKTEVMQLPNRDRRRIKQLSQNNYNSQDVFSGIFGEKRRSKTFAKLTEPLSAGAGSSLQMTNIDVEIRKRYEQPLASESGEFPDTSSIESRMSPICHETGINSGHAPDAAHFMTVATETFIKEVLSSIFSKTRSNGPGTSGNAGTGGGANWIQTRKYRIQLEKEEEASLRGKILRDKSGLLPVEARAASERGPLGMADIRMALELGDCGIGQMPSVFQQIMLGYREGEVDLWNDFTFKTDHSYDIGQGVRSADEDVEMSGMREDINSCIDNTDTNEWGWEGCQPEDLVKLDNLLDSCLAL
ncbi:Transcriptional coactivator HFI1/ADA1 [Golovinomyces cichoracearum]|uniref:Transcriptional coactivator HFI1/ADA1 n=1 Tax=Golovinomyces cichoracearum TaxID=62708 RepID=A0A420H8F2_9PEZI|nr:Transcriptional coactivator HFI1/ADA1 [Golovinomyces cichoracearum]